MREPLHVGMAVDRKQRLGVTDGERPQLQSFGLGTGEMRILEAAQIERKVDQILNWRFWISFGIGISPSVTSADRPCRSATRNPIMRVEVPVDVILKLGLNGVVSCDFVT